MALIIRIMVKNLIIRLFEFKLSTDVYWASIQHIGEAPRPSATHQVHAGRAPLSDASRPGVHAIEVHKRSVHEIRQQPAQPERQSKSCEERPTRSQLGAPSDKLWKGTTPPDEAGW